MSPQKRAAGSTVFHKTGTSLASGNYFPYSQPLASDRRSVGAYVGALAQLKSAVANQQLIIDGLEEKIRQEEKRRALFNRLAPVRRHTRTDTLLCTPACFFPLLPAPQHIAPSFCSQMSVSGLDTSGCRTSKAAPAPSCKDAGARRCVDDAGKGGGDGEKG